MNRYLARIGLEDIASRDAATLALLQRRHLLTVPFENLDIHFGRRIEIDPARSIEKIVNYRRGGFCYELNGAFGSLLADLGFRVTLLSARVFNARGELGEEYDHLTLRVDLEESWLVDVGFGDSFREPMRLAGGVQNDGWSDYRIVERDGARCLARREGDAWRDQFLLTLQPREMEEFEGMCTFHQTSPLSPFTRKRVCTIATEEGRLTLSERTLIRTTRSAREERIVADEEEWAGVLRDHFGVEL